MHGPRLDDPDLPLQQMFERWPEVALVFQSRGMACLGCPIAPFHTVIDACAEYQLNVASFRNALNAAVSASP